MLNFKSLKMSKINLVDADDLVSKIVDRLQTINTTKDELLGTDEKPVGIKEMADYLGFSPNYVRRLCQQKKLPHKKLEGKNGPILMYKSEIRAWVDSHSVKTLEEIRKDVNFNI